MFVLRYIVKLSILVSNPSTSSAFTMVKIQTSLKHLLAGLATSALPLVKATGFDADSRTNVAVYWGMLTLGIVARLSLTD